MGAAPVTEKVLDLVANRCLSAAYGCALLCQCALAVAAVSIGLYGLTVMLILAGYACGVYARQLWGRT